MTRGRDQALVGPEWDEVKRRWTLDNRGLDFSDAISVIEGDGLTVEDDRKDYGERRFQTIGLLAKLIVMVVWTPREGGYRIISMRVCNADERRQFTLDVGRSG